MVKMALKLGVNALAIWVAVQFVTGLSFDSSEGWTTLAILAVVLGLVNAVIKPIVKFFSFPAVLLSLGLFLIVINIAMFGLLVLLSDSFSLGLSADGFVPIVIGGFIVSLVAWVGEIVIPED
ncbi:MAG: putative membrane protein [Nitriliruptoraceae bacterium]|jgi:putative membrane protein